MTNTKACEHRKNSMLFELNAYTGTTFMIELSENQRLGESNKQAEIECIGTAEGRVLMLNNFDTGITVLIRKKIKDKIK